MNKIPWKRYPITIDTCSGRPIEAIIHYWAKDYYIEIWQPFYMKLQGPHMMYAIAAHYVLVKSEDPVNGHREIPILEECKNRILRHFVEGAI